MYSMKCPICGQEMKKNRKDYKYEESGLNNIILTGIEVHECKCGEEIPEIKNIEKINRFIANALVIKNAPLNGKEFRFVRKQMDFKEKDIASLLGVSPVSVSRWENSNAKIGLSNDKLIRLLYTQTLEEQYNKVFKGTIESIQSIKRDGKQKLIKISGESLTEDKVQVTDEHQLALEIRSLIESNTELSLCENISKIIKKSGLSDHPLAQLIEEIPKKLCPVVFRDILSEEMRNQVSVMVNEFLEQSKKKEISTKEIQMEHKCPTKNLMFSKGLIN